MRKHAPLLILLFILVVFNVSIFQKEDLRSNGELVLVELAPVDPRSLMQGDYMRLRYKLVDDARAVLRKQRDAENAPAEAPRYKFIIVQLDENRRATFGRFYLGQNLADNERLIDIQHKHLSNPQEISITPTSFFFQEGHAALYEAAKFGMMRLKPNGEHLLVGLADERGQEIKPGVEEDKSSAN